jgi:hypothetical protein
MSRIALIIVATVLVLLVGATVYLSTVDLPVQRERVEKVLPSDLPPS